MMDYRFLRFPEGKCKAVTLSYDHALVRSVDGKRIYNPTLIAVWFLDDKQLYCINPGETLVIE